MKNWFGLAVLAGLLWGQSALANGPVIKAVSASKTSAQGTRTFSVTLRHHDTGWEHYADRFELLAPDGSLIAKRVLYHPHVKEQPFTRSQSGVTLPSNIPHIFIRAHDSVHGYGPKVRVEVPGTDIRIDQKFD